MTAAIRATLEGDPFEVALAVDAVAVAYERRTAGWLVHRPVDARVLVAIASALRLSDFPATLSLYDRILALQARIEELPQEKRKELVDALVTDARRTPWRPTRGAQAQTFELTSSVDVVLAAGGAGSGKTEAVLGAALFQSRNARFLRKTSLEFAPLLKRIAELVGSTDGRNLASMSWELPAPFGCGGRGVNIEMTSVNDPDSHLRAQGRAVDGLFPDDVGNSGVSRESIFFIANWLRSAERIPKKLVLTSNPPSNSDALWLREFFAPWLDPSYKGARAGSGEVRWFLPSGDKSVEVPAGTNGAQSRTVVMSTVDDNPRLLRTGYKKQLANAPTELLRKRLLFNDWSAGFDQDDVAQVVPSAWIKIAMDRWKPLADRGEMLSMGVDVSRGGADSTVLARRHIGYWFDEPLRYQGADTVSGSRVAGVVIAAMRDACPVHIDVTGVGSSPYDYLRDVGVHVLGVTFGAKATRRDKSGQLEFANLRAQLWWMAREVLDPEANNGIALPPDEQLLRELAAPRFQIRAAKLYVESREEIIKRIGRSPDYATAYILALMDTPKVQQAEAQPVVEHDPYAQLAGVRDPYERVA